MITDIKLKLKVYQHNGIKDMITGRLDVELKILEEKSQFLQ